MTENPFASTTSLDVNPFDDPFADQDSVNKPSQYSHELAASRVAELDRRENDLERRERELHQKAETIRKHGRNNWPPCQCPQSSIRIRKNNPHSSLLVFSIVLPLVYHDISEEIPEASRPLITRLYLLWLVLVGTLIVNMVACIFVLTSGGSDGLKDLIASIVYVPAWMGSLVDQQLWTASLQLLPFYRSCYGIGVWLRLRIVMSSSFPVTLGQSIMDI